jgi:dihydrodipicolinate synthase/N-acetylneuraminate lyase
VQANLVECGNLGRMAFLEAEDKMGVIQLTSQVINGKVC